MQKILQKTWQCNHCYSLMAWNNKDMPLHNGVLPPFLYGKGIHNNWVIHEAMSSEFRIVFDASWTITSFHLNDKDDFNPTFWNSTALDIENRNWEYIGNSHIGAQYGSFFFGEAYSSLLKLLKCNNKYIFVDTKKNIVYPIEDRGAMNLWKEKIFPSWLNENTMYCVDRLKSLARILDCSLKDQTRIPAASLELPFSLESLLSVTADKTKTIILTAAGYSYKDMLMSWVCRLRKLSIENFIVCALDKETYQFSILQVCALFLSKIKYVLSSQSLFNYFKVVIILFESEFSFPLCLFMLSAMVGNSSFQRSNSSK